MMRLVAASELPVQTLCEVWGAVYAGYKYQGAYTREQLQRLLGTGSVDLSLSPVWFGEDGRAAGLSFLGARGRRGWIGSFGVVPAWRGQGLAGRLLDLQLAWAAAAGLHRVQLEVLADNGAAIRVYERAGFKRTRDLAVLQSGPAWPVQPAPGATPLEGLQAKALLERLHGEALPTWQREPRALAVVEGLECLALGEAGALAFERRAGLVRLVDVALAPQGDGPAVLGALLSGLRATAGDVPAVLVNEPVEGLTDLLVTQGFVVMDRQVEMAVAL